MNADFLEYPWYYEKASVTSSFLSNNMIPVILTLETSGQNVQD